MVFFIEVNSPWFSYVKLAEGNKVQWELLY